MSFLPIRRRYFPGQAWPAFAMIVLASLGSAATAVERDVQFKSIDFTTQIIELHNFGSTDQAMDGWRFCSHSDDNF